MKRTHWVNLIIIIIIMLFVQILRIYIIIIIVAIVMNVFIVPWRWALATHSYEASSCECPVWRYILRRYLRQDRKVPKEPSEVMMEQ